MTPEQQAALNRAISEKRNEFIPTGCGCMSCRDFRQHLGPLPWCSDWRYAGKLLEELLAREDVRKDTLLLDHYCTVPAIWRIRHMPDCFDGATMPEAIALAWAKAHGAEIP